MLRDFLRRLLRRPLDYERLTGWHDYFESLPVLPPVAPRGQEATLALELVRVQRTMDAATRVGPPEDQA